jgi:hypothetical protein
MSNDKHVPDVPAYSWLKPPPRIYQSPATRPIGA